jgi:hypothetical protein
VTGWPLLLMLAASVGADPPLRIEPVADDGLTVRVVARLPAATSRVLPSGSVSRAVGRELLTFSILGENGEPGRSMLGSYARDGEQLTFVPRFPLSRGSRYRATLVLPSSQRVSTDYSVAQATAPARSVVTSVYPSSDVLPANALKFYIHFSQPMRNGRAIFDRIRLLDEDGRKIPDPWRRTELWTTDDKRFTLWIHPGRVKRGVNLREDFGPVLKPNRTYTLVISTEVLDAAGQPLASEHRKMFRTTAEDFQRLQPETWSFSSPETDTREPLTIDFGKPLDHALLQRCLEVRRGTGMLLPGAWSTDRDESRAVFVPASNWPAVPLHLKVDGILEDLAGNTPLRAFDTDLTSEDAGKAVLSLPLRLHQ